VIENITVGHRKIGSKHSNNCVKMASNEVWKGALRLLEETVTAFNHEAWLRPLCAQERAGGLRLGCPNDFHQLRVRERFLKQIEHATAQVAGRPIAVELFVEPTSAPSHSASVDATVCAAVPTNTAAIASLPIRKVLQPELPYGFGSFITGTCNALAREASYALATGTQPGISPLLLAAPSGLGKTHLARSTANTARTSGVEKVIYASAERFTSEFLSAIQARGMERFKERYRQRCDLLIIEDVQFLSGKKQTQLELFHTIEHLRNAGARVMFTSDRLPRNIEKLDPRLSSHMTSGLVAEIEPPDAAVRRSILRDRAARGGIHLPADCLELLVEKTHGNVRDLEGVLTQLVATATLLQRKVDLDLTEKALYKVLPAPVPDHVLDAEAIIDVVAGFFKTSPSSLASRSRRREIVLPRQLAMYFCHKYTDASLKQIGRAFNKNHPSVSNAIKVIERGILERPPLRYQFEAITKRIESLKRRQGAQRFLHAIDG